MIIRKAVIEDASAMKELHDRAVMKLCQNDYTPEQLMDWVNKSSLEKYLWRLETQRIFIAELDGKMLGFVRWYPKTNELCSICVDPDHTRQGIATKLMKYVYVDAIDLGMSELWLDASFTAVPFYQALGWDNVAFSTVGSLDCVRMVKNLHPKWSHGNSNLE
jgi:putative acetyltransferase